MVDQGGDLRTPKGLLSRSDDGGMSTSKHESHLRNWYGASEVRATMCKIQQQGGERDVFVRKMTKPKENMLAIEKRKAYSKRKRQKEEFDFFRKFVPNRLDEKLTFE